jgi:glycerol uptake facilitator-like aquaporin
MQIFLSELIGTFILVAVILMSQNTVFIAIAFLGAILVAGLSGGHINPVVTMIMAIKGKIPRVEIPEYLSGQIAGALAAYMLTKNKY